MNWWNIPELDYEGDFDRHSTQQEINANKILAGTLSWYFRFLHKDNGPEGTKYGLSQI